jgi:hypothetical protein
MTTETSSIPDAMDAFVAGMMLRPNIATAIADGLKVASGYLGEESGRKESIELTHVQTATQVWGMIGNRRREEEYRISGLVWATVGGKNEPIIKAARDRAFELLAEIEDFLRVDPTIGGTTKVSEVAAYPFDQGVTPDGRYCQIDFEILCKKSLRSS